MLHMSIGLGGLMPPLEAAMFRLVVRDNNTNLLLLADGFTAAQDAAKFGRTILHNHPIRHNGMTATVLANLANVAPFGLIRQMTLRDDIVSFS